MLVALSGSVLITTKVPKLTFFLPSLHCQLLEDKAMPRWYAFLGNVCYKVWKYGITRIWLINTYTYNSKWNGNMYINDVPYSLKFSRIKYFAVLPNSAQKQIFTDKIFMVKVSRLALHQLWDWNFVGENFHGHTLTCEIRENFQPQKFWLYGMYCAYIC